MTTLTPILYADGALRLTDHGPRGGGVVLVHVPSGRQINLPYNAPVSGAVIVDMLGRELASRCRVWSADEVFTQMFETYTPPSQRDKFAPFYHG